LFFSRLLNIPDVVHSLRFAYYDLEPENPLGFCSSKYLRCVRVGFRLHFDGITICHSTEKRAGEPPIYLLVSVFQPDFTDWPKWRSFKQRFSCLNPVGLPLALTQIEASRFGYVRGLHSTGFITDCQCDRSRWLFYVGTVGQIPLGETALRSL